MKIEGSFKNIKDEDVKVVFFSMDDVTAEPIIINKDDLYFGDDPVEIDYCMDDLFQPIIAKRCTIKLVIKKFLGHLLYAKNERDIKVNVLVGDEIIFAGFVEPNVYSQDLNKEYDELQIVCTDILAALQYRKINDIIDPKYIDVFTLVNKIISSYNADIDISGKRTPDILYDNSLVYEEVKEQQINTAVFISDETDETDDTYTVLEEVLKYYNFHIIQEGINFYIFSNCKQDINKIGGWKIINREDQTNVWPVIPVGGSYSGIGNRVMTDWYAGNDASISYDEVYNDLKLTCDILPVEDLFTSPTDPENFVQPFDGRQLYAYEQMSGNTSTAQMLWMSKLCLNKDMYGNDVPNYGDPQDPRYLPVKYNNDWDEGKQKLIPWYFRLQHSTNWILNDAIGENVNDRINYWVEHGKNVWQNKSMLIRTHPVDNEFGTNFGETTITPMLCSFGAMTNLVELSKKGKVAQLPSMDDYLLINVHGQRTKMSDNKWYVFPTEKALAPKGYGGTNLFKIEYNSPSVFSLEPQDKDVTNYIVFSGEFLLQGTQELSNKKWKDNYVDGANMLDPVLKRKQFAVTTNDGLEYYNMIMYDARTPRIWHERLPEDPVGYEPLSRNYLSAASVIFPPTEKAQKRFQYNYNEDGTTDDRLKNVPVIECEFSITDSNGKKVYFVEWNDENNKYLAWKGEDELPEDKLMINENGEYETVANKKTFSLGFDPQIGDYIIGQKHEIQNTVDANTNLEGISGFALPITYEDAKNYNFTGKVNFKILGPVNSEFKNVVRRHPTWFRHTKYYVDGYNILEYVENIFIKDFECKLFSDNGKKEVLEDKDVIFVTKQTNMFNNNTKDDISFRLNTNYSAQMKYDIGLKDGVYLSTVKGSEKGVTNNFKAALDENGNIIYDTDGHTPVKAHDIAEKMYLDDYHRLYDTPKLIYETTVKDDFVWKYNNKRLNFFWNTICPWYITYEIFGKSENFWLIGKTSDIKNCTCKIKLRQCS